MICDLFYLTSKSKICKNCNKEFRNRASEYCSTNCAMNDLHDSDNKDKNYVHQIITAKLFLLNFECIAYSEQEVFEFINKLKDKDHTILLFKNEHIRDTIVTEFFDKSKNDIFTACFTHNTFKYKCDKAISYNELSDNQILLTNKISEFLVDVLDKTYPHAFPRIACEDTAWFSEAGFFEEHQKLGNTLDKKVIDESVILCCYNILKLDEEKMDTVLQSRDFIILDEPLSVFRRK